MDVDVRVAHQHVVHDDLGDAAGDHGADGDTLMAVGLQNGVGQRHEADEDAGDAQHLQMGAGRRGSLRLGRIEHAQDGAGEHTEAHARRNGQNGDEAEGGGDEAVGAALSLRAMAAAAKGMRLMVTG